MTEYIAKFSGNVRFLDNNDIKLYDYDGNQIDIPKCSNCECFKSQLIGKESFTWICMNGCENTSNFDI